MNTCTRFGVPNSRADFTVYNSVPRIPPEHLVGSLRGGEQGAFQVHVLPP